MGTRSLTIFKDAAEETPEFAVLYRQFDGYPTGMGADILECFKGKVVVNGYSGDDEINGAGDMAVQLIAFLKVKSCSRVYDFKAKGLIDKPVNTPGGLYLFAPNTRDAWEDYIYTITCPKPPEDRSERWKGKLLLTVVGGDKLLYEGLLDDFDPEATEKLESGDSD